MKATRWKAHGLVVLAAFFLAGSSWPVRAALGSEQLDSRRFLDAYRTALLRLQAACGSGYLEGMYTSQWFGARADRPEREATLEWDTEVRPEGRGSSQLMVHTPVLYYDRPAPKTSVDLSFQLTNSGPKPVRVAGMRFGCAAILPAEDLPCRVEAGQTKRLALKLLASLETKTGEIRSPLYLYTTAAGQAEVELTLVGRRNTGNR